MSETMQQVALVPRERLALLGVPIDNLTMAQTVEAIDCYIQLGGFHQIATANVDFLMKAVKDDELMDILQRCSLVVADGMPLVWASRVLKTPLQERVTGADLVGHLAQLSARKSYGIFLLGASEKRNAAAALAIETTYPGARVAGRYSPPLASLEDMDSDEILRRIEASAPDILMVAFGNPKQEKWIDRHRARLKVPVVIGVGASIDFLSGDHERAPRWMQVSGMEWAHRMYKEPGRLARRYSSNAAWMVRYLSVQLLVMSTQPAGVTGLMPDHESVDEVEVIRVTGRFTGETVRSFDALVERVGTGGAVVVDLAETDHVGADALGSLISLRSRVSHSGGRLWLSGLRPGVRRVLRAAYLEHRFQLAPQVSEARRALGMINSGED